MPLLTSLLSHAKQALTVAGARLPERAITQVQASVNYLRLGRTLREHGYNFPRRLASREQVWQSILTRVRDRRVLYLEFGVAYGESMRFWASELSHPGAMLHGFDSFEGLPESIGPWRKGQFASDGAAPAIGDTRVRFFKGWFQETLPTYKVPEHEVLVVNMDADLYSSTVYVLRFLREHIRPGTFVYFDELNHVDHEWRAFCEFRSETGLEFKAVAADRSLAFAAFECSAHARDAGL